MSVSVDVGQDAWFGRLLPAASDSPAPGSAD